MESENSTEVGEKSPKGQNVLSGISTAERLANEFNVSPKTIQRDADFAKGLDKLSPELRHEVLQGKSKISKSDIIALSKNEANETITNLAQPTDFITAHETDTGIQNEKAKTTAKIATLEADIRRIATKNLNKKVGINLRENSIN